MSSFMNINRVIHASTDAPTHHEISSSVRLWQQRVRNVQGNQMTPEVLQRVREQADRQKRAATASKRAKRLETINKVSTYSNAQALRGWASSAEQGTGQTAYSAPAAEDLAATSGIYMNRSIAIQRCIDTYRTNDALDDDDTCDDELNALDNEISMERAAQSAPQALVAARIVPDTDTNDVATQEIEALLVQLAREPSDEVEMAAKFQLFENYLSTVTTIREETLNFWEANKDQFSGATLTDGERSIREIDSADAMGIDQFRTDKWFVYYMTQKANSNNKKITATLAAMRAKLELLSQELGECPFCLDQLVPDAVTTLGCCHKTCKACWDHWVRIKGSEAFCPLCKHQKFVEVVIRDFPE